MLKIVVSLLFVFFGTSRVQAEAICGKNLVLLFCRGGNQQVEFINKAPDVVSHGSRWEEHVTFEKSKVVNTWRGQNLEPGQCSFLDHAIGESEPNRLVFVVNRIEGKIPEDPPAFVIDHLNRCVSDRDCAFRVCAMNVENEYFYTIADRLSIYGLH